MMATPCRTCCGGFIRDGLGNKVKKNDRGLGVLYGFYILILNKQDCEVFVYTLYLYLEFVHAQIVGVFVHYRFSHT